MTLGSAQDDDTTRKRKMVMIPGSMGDDSDDTMWRVMHVSAHPNGRARCWSTKRGKRDM